MKTDSRPLESLQIRLNFSGRMVVKSDWHPPAPVASYSRFYYCESGRAWLSHSGQTFTMEPGHLYLIPARRMLDHGCPEEMVICWCRFAATILGGMDLFDYLTCEYETEWPTRSELEGLLARCRELWNAEKDEASFEASTILRRMLQPFLQSVDPERQAVRKHQIARYYRVTEFINEHIHEPLRVPELAQIANLETSRFSVQFKRYFHVSPHRYILLRRIELALRFLWDTDATLSDIAEQTGFSSQFHLSKAFKQAVGRTPSDFRMRKPAV